MNKNNNMLELQLTKAMELKHMMMAISRISEIADIECTAESTQIHATHKSRQLINQAFYSHLHLSAFFFQRYYISRPFVISVNVSDINNFLKLHADDNSGVLICSKDYSPITSIDFHVLSKNNKTETLTLNVEEELSVAERQNHKLSHEFKISIQPNFFLQFAQHSATFRIPMHITVGNTYIMAYGVAIRKGGIIKNKQGKSEFKIEGAPKGMRYELLLPSKVLAESFIWASSIANVVYINDSYSRTKDPILLEFDLDPYARLLYYIHNPIVEA